MAFRIARTFIVLVLAAFSGASADAHVDATNPELAKMVTDLEQLVRSQREKLQELEVERERRLADEGKAEEEFLVDNLWNLPLSQVGAPYLYSDKSPTFDNTDQSPTLFSAEEYKKQIAAGTAAADLPTMAKKKFHPYGIYGELQVAMTHMWVLLCGALVMFMQAGFALLEAGSCRVKNVQNIMLKNLVDVTIGTVAWYVFGFSFAFSGPFNSDGFKENGFIGGEQFMAHTFMDSNRDDGQIEPTSTMLMWFFQWTFCSAASTIVSGGCAERVNLPAYALYSFFMTAWIYPICVATTWGGGFLASMNDIGYMDFAGSGIVHFTGGVGALCGAIVAGPRNGRFTGLSLKERVLTSPEAFNPHNLPLVVLGTLILWFGWYGFNCGSTLAMENLEAGLLAGQIAVNTTVAASTGGLSVFLIRLAMLRKYDITGFCNGILAGLVAITAGCGNVETGSAMIIGFIGALIYQGCSTLLRILQVDDPLDAFPVHGGCGMWGVLAAALFDWGTDFSRWHGWSGFRCKVYGEGHAREGECVDDAWSGGFAANIVEIIFIFIWVAIWSLLIFGISRRMGWLRATDDLQDLGFDEKKHSPSKGYNYDDIQPGTSI